MVTREDIQTVITETQPYATEVFITEIINLIEADQAQYTALVDAVKRQLEAEGNAVLATYVQDAIHPFLERKLSEKLEKLADDFYTETDEASIEKIRQLADEAREVEKW